MEHDKKAEGDWPCSPDLARRIRELVDDKSKQIEANVTSIALALHKEIREEQRNIRREVRHDHSENRARMQANLEAAAESVAQNRIIMAEQQNTRTLMLELLGEVRSLDGRIVGEKAAEDRFAAEESAQATLSDRKRAWWFNILRWVLGLGGGGGALKWLLDHHWGGK